MSSNRIIAALSLFLFLTTAQTVSSADSLAVFDATGKRIGALQGIEGGKVHIVLQKDGIPLSFVIEPEQFTGSDGSVRFESTDCTGQPLIEDSGKILPGTGIFTSTVYVADLSTASRVRIIFSSLSQSSASCVSSFSQGAFFSALEFPNLLAQFTPPYRVQTESSSSNFPALIRGAGSLSQVVVGAGNTALSVDSSFHAPDGSLIETRSTTIPPLH